MNEKKYYLNNIKSIKDFLKFNSELVVKDFIIGTDNKTEGSIIYLDGITDRELIDRGILSPLMTNINEPSKSLHSMTYLCKKYLTTSNIEISIDLSRALEELKRGKTLLFVDRFSQFVIINTVGGIYRSISDPVNETSVRSSREGFVENLETNISLIKRRLKDNNLISENFKLGRRSQTDIVMLYIKDIANEDSVSGIRDRLTSIDINSATFSGIIEQLIEKHSYSIFPQVFSTERPDMIESNLLEGKIAILVSGTPFALTLPCTFADFFQTVEDYTHRTLVSSLVRILRLFSLLIILLLPALYITLLKFNSELIPTKFIKAIIESRKNIALTPFISILSMSVTIEFLREGGLRLPAKIGQTISVVGGIIIGDAAIEAKIVSPTTLLVIGIVTVSTFVIPNYEMSLSIRLLSLPMIIIGNLLGMYGVLIGIFFILAYLCSLDSFGIPYLHFHKRDLRDIFIRDAIRKLTDLPKIMLNKSTKRLAPKKLKHGARNE